MKNSSKKLYCCFSIPQRDYLTENGIQYEICGLNPNSKHMFWVYIRNKELNDVLQTCGKGKPKQ